MKDLKTFYKFTYWFWVFSKFILIAMLLISTLQILAEGRLNSLELFVNLLGLGTAVLLIITFLSNFFSEPKWNMLKVLTGSLLVLMGFALIIVLLTIPSGNQSSLFFLGFPLSFWMIFVGIFDLLKMHRNTEI